MSANSPLCLNYDGSNLTVQEITDVSECSGYVAIHNTEYQNYLDIHQLFNVPSVDELQIIFWLAFTTPIFFWFIGYVISLVRRTIKTWK